ncbi:hypothetical protein BLOT_016430 [Blomia tropicalis]|nr:hypothetical protein BLOT_016430 [Blomia tropicalis]
MRYIRMLMFGLTFVLSSHAIIFFQGRTTACDTCDGISTNSVRNIGCCLKFSKCCIPDTLDEYNTRVQYEDDVLYGRRSPTTTAPKRNSRKRSNPTKKSNNKKNKSTKKKSINSKSGRRLTSRSTDMEPKWRIVRIESW